MSLITRALAALTLLAVLTACGTQAAAPAAEATIAPTGAPTATAATAATPQAATVAAASADAAFPLTIKHKYGSTTIEKVPERIVTVGLTDHDALLALGVVPVGTTEWFGEYPSSVWP
jgi:iron complex transport system substrate-binding protein